MSRPPPLPNCGDWQQRIHRQTTCSINKYGHIQRSLSLIAPFRSGILTAIKFFANSHTGIVKTLLWILLLIPGVILGAENFQKLQSLAASKYGEATAYRVQKWLILLERNQSQPDSEKLFAANDFFNVQIQFTNDITAWQTNDYWATPLETLHKLQGDCEDFALAKYVTLINLGIPEEKLRLIYVNAQIGPNPSDTQAHMVLAYYPTATAVPLILDNLVPGIRLATDRKDLQPVFSFNATELQVTGQSTTYRNPQSRLSKWQDALQRIKQQGFFDDVN